MQKKKRDFRATKLLLYRRYVSFCSLEYHLITDGSIHKQEIKIPCQLIIWSLDIMIQDGY